MIFKPLLINKILKEGYSNIYIPQTTAQTAIYLRQLISAVTLEAMRQPRYRYFLSVPEGHKMYSKFYVDLLILKDKRRDRSHYL